MMKMLLPKYEYNIYKIPDMSCTFIIKIQRYIDNLTAPIILLIIIYGEIYGHRDT